MPDDQVENREQRHRAPLTRADHPKEERYAARDLDDKDIDEDVRAVTPHGWLSLCLAT